MGELDIEFYQTFYEDLRELGQEQATLHWQQHGQNENRHPNFASLVNALGLDHRDLPNGFDWAEYLSLHRDLAGSGFDQWQAKLHWLRHGVAEERVCQLSQLLEKYGFSRSQIPQDFDHETYLALNPDVREKGLVTFPLAAIHYLENGCALPYRIDVDFYCGVYGVPTGENARESAIRHWNEVGRKNALLPNLPTYIASIGLRRQLEYYAFGPEDLARLNPDATIAGWKTVLDLYRQDPQTLLQPFDDPVRSALFYRELAQSYEELGKSEQAQGLYLHSLATHEDAITLMLLGQLALHEKKWKASLRWFKKSAAMGNTAPSLFVAIADIHVHLNDPERALGTLLEGIDANPDSSHLERIAQKKIIQFWESFQHELDYLADTDERTELVDKAREATESISAVVSAVVKKGPQPVVGRCNQERVAIIGDYHLPQCKRYRIDQKIEQLKGAGFRVTATPWISHQGVDDAVNWNDIILFYRCPGVPHIVRAISAARALGKITFYEIDDLIFDPIYPPPLSTYGGLVDSRQYRNLVKGMALNRAAASLCEYGIASTKPLVERLGELVSSGQCYLHRNALDSLNSNIQPDSRKYSDGLVNIFYGSGTKAHNSDFIDQALPALDKILSDNRNVRLSIAGFLELPKQFSSTHRAQLNKLPFVNSIYGYWEILRRVNINMAVLGQDPMTDCKSELKWFEAAVFSVPSVVSSTRNYEDVINHGVDGFIAHSPDDWSKWLQALIDSTELREEIGGNARERVIEEYSLHTMSENIERIIQSACDAHLLGTPSQ